MGLYSIYDSGTLNRSNGDNSKDALRNYIIENGLISGDYDIILGSYGDSDYTVREISEHNFKAISQRKVYYKIKLITIPTPMVKFD